MSIQSFKAISAFSALISLVSVSGCTAESALENPQSEATESSESDSDEEVASTSQALNVRCTLAAALDKAECVSFANAGCEAQGIGCNAEANAACEPYYRSALAACNNVNVSLVYRTVRTMVLPEGLGRARMHAETMVPASGDTIEARFTFASAPQAGANQSPIFRCRALGYDDFLSLASDCEGQVKISFPGYSFPPNAKGARAVYRCRAKRDHFISTDPNCEGQVRESLIGYAK